MAGQKAGDAELSPRLAELAAPGLRSAPPARQAERVGLPERGPGSLLRAGNRLLAELRFERAAAAAVDEVRATGAKIVDVSRRYQTITVAAEAAQLRAIAAVPRLLEAAEVLAPVVSASGCKGLATSEGDAQLAASSAREAFAVDGGGVGVGILSDSFNLDATAVTHAGDDVATGDLPGAGNPCGHGPPVSVLDDSSDPSKVSDEGRAMAQIVHDLAPGAALSFATAFNGESSFAGNIEALAAPPAVGGAGARVIVDDVFYPAEPFFQDGPVAKAINKVTAEGVAYFSAAGNNNILSGGLDVASYEAPFRDAGACPVGLPPTLTQCMDFDPGEPGVDDAYDLEVAPGGEVLLDLQWAEPWFGVGTNLDAYLLDESGTVLSESTGANNVRPFEFLFWENEEGPAEVVRLVIARAAGESSPTLKFVQIGNGAMDVFPTQAQYEASSAGDVIGPAIIGHSGAASATTVGAVRYSNGSQPEPYSSRGPAMRHFAPITGTASPAAALGVPQEIAKPDVVATDCGATTFFLPPKTLGAFRFCGTSAAAPHAAAVAALMRQASPGLSYPQLRATLAATASPVGSFGPDAVGAGLVDAFDAVAAVAPPPTISIVERPPALGRNRQPTIAFTASHPVAFSCSIDGGDPQPCGTPYVPPVPLEDGFHGFVVRGVDAAGRTGSSELVGFEIDTKRPRTFFRRHPRKTIRTPGRRAKAVFRFGSNEPNVTFVCRVDAGLLRFCDPRLVRRYRLGKHVVWVKARDAAGNIDRSAAVFRFQVKRPAR